MQTQAEKAQHKTVISCDIAAFEQLMDVARQVVASDKAERWNHSNARPIVEKAAAALGLFATVFHSSDNRDSNGQLPALDDAVRALRGADFPNTADELAKLGDDFLSMRDGFNALYDAYVAQLEDFARRITDLGGSCHPVNVLEQNDPALMSARALMVRVGGAA